MQNADDIDYLTVEHLNNHPPFPLSAEKVDEYNKILETIRHRIQIARFSKEASDDLLFDKHENRCFHTDPKYNKIQHLARQARRQSDFTVKRFMALEKRILRILRENNMTPK